MSDLIQCPKCGLRQTARHAYCSRCEYAFMGSPDEYVSDDRSEPTGTPSHTPTPQTPTDRPSTFPARETPRTDSVRAVPDGDRLVRDRGSLGRRLSTPASPIPEPPVDTVDELPSAPAWEMPSRQTSSHRAATVSVDEPGPVNRENTAEELITGSYRVRGRPQGELYASERSLPPEDPLMADLVAGRVSKEPKYTDEFALAEDWDRPRRVAAPRGRPRTNPGVRPRTNPGVRPRTNPGVRPRTNPGVRPRTNPGVRPTPAARPLTNPGARPFTNPGGRPFTNPGARPRTNPGVRPPTNPHRRLTNPGESPRPSPGPRRVTDTGARPRTNPRPRRPTNPRGTSLTNPGIRAAAVGDRPRTNPSMRGVGVTGSTRTATNPGTNPGSDILPTSSQRRVVAPGERPSRPASTPSAPKPRSTPAAEVPVPEPRIPISERVSFSMAGAWTFVVIVVLLAGIAGRDVLRVQRARGAVMSTLNEGVSEAGPTADLPASLQATIDDAKLSKNLEGTWQRIEADSQRFVVGADFAMAILGIPVNWRAERTGFFDVDERIRTLDVYVKAGWELDPHATKALRDYEQEREAQLEKERADAEEAQRKLISGDDDDTTDAP